MSIIIRDEFPADIEAIHALTIAAFANAPHTDNTEQFIVKALRDSGALALSLVAQLGAAELVNGGEDGKQLVGHVALSRVEIIGNGSELDWFGLGPISVAPAQQRQGIGTELMLAAMARLEALGAGGCVLLGDPAYYQRFGFAPVPGLVLPGVPPEYFMARRFAGDWPAGEVRYHSAFSATD
ncbi:N-acetyltransferase [Shewanella sp. JM162201]|uniref:N-acetyltransferase n=1 Tax=Shewanella jiangmenensis TaxID=2837387 RepID=A0ABS5V5N8_9GAMM|nr:N-acetyltransferase [Shewanella jiangmenensis]MBT1444358.1 N-acetyltransferase [Shewanella jiangmenensis]